MMFIPLFLIKKGIIFMLDQTLNICMWFFLILLISLYLHLINLLIVQNLFLISLIFIYFFT